MAGGTVLLSVLSLFYDFRLLIPLHAAVQLVSNASRAWFLRRRVTAPMFWPFVCGSSLGVAFGAWALSSIHDDRWPSLFIALYILYELLKPKKLPSIRVSNKGFFWVGLLIGSLSMFVGATGLILGVFIVNQNFSKEATVANQAAMQTFNHAAKLVGFFSIGINFLTESTAFMTMSVGAVLGTRLGVYLLERMPTRLFFWVFRAVLVVAAIKILWSFW